MMFKKLLILLTVLAISVAGCGGKGKTPAGEDVPAAESTEETHEEAEQEEGEEAEETASEEVPAATEENSHDLILQTLGEEDVAQIEVPAFLTYTEHAASYVKASDDETYEVTYMYYGAWDKERFFTEVVNAGAYIESESFSNVEEGEMQTADISGKSAEWKKISALYEGEIGLVQYGAVIDVEGGVLGVNMYVYDEGDTDEAFFEVLQGITLK